jgi:hypothetical protein
LQQALHYYHQAYYNIIMVVVVPSITTIGRCTSHHHHHHNHNHPIGNLGATHTRRDFQCYEPVLDYVQQQEQQQHEYERMMYLHHQQQQQQLETQVEYRTLLVSALCHNMAILYQNEYSNMYMSLLLRCQIIHTLQQQEQRQLLRQRQQQQHSPHPHRHNHNTTRIYHGTPTPATTNNHLLPSTLRSSRTTTTSSSSSSSSATQEPPTVQGTVSGTTGSNGNETNDYVFFHLGIFFAMINDFQLAPAA